MNKYIPIVNNSISMDVFSRAYPQINDYLMKNGNSMDSRYGHTKEILNFKTEIKNPYARLVGNNKRDVNVFFLLAEAMWIFKGERDVDFLTIFNSKMSEFSDDGKVFHAPYGFRLRRYGVDSNFELMKSPREQTNHEVQQRIEGEDQILTAMEMLSKNPDDRRVVMSIWNTELDLNTKSKDIPCNDLVMLKVRDGELHTTIANRSNDLHWGLPTNIFQFSFVTEIMSNILGIHLGTQTHNSQSLHLYTDNPIAERMQKNMKLSKDGNFNDLYDDSDCSLMKMNFESTTIGMKLVEVDLHLIVIMHSLRNRKKMSEGSYEQLKSFSKYLLLIYDLLSIYVEYKDSNKKTDLLRIEMIKKIERLSTPRPNLDIITMGKNFFATRIKDEKIKEQYSSMGNL